MGLRLRVDPILCTGHALCAELLPEVVTLDEWGYPIFAPVPGELRDLARRAVADCPALALSLIREPSGGEPRGASRA
jgi:ferredoxin